MSKILISTSLGDIEFTLRPDKAPITTANILQYVDDKFYDGSVFHRVIDGFMIQGLCFRLKVINVKVVVLMPIWRDFREEHLSKMSGTMASRIAEEV